MRPIVWQTSVSILEQALKVEQRSDVRIRLPVIVTEQAFVVTDQAREHVRRDELEVIRKSLRSSELNCSVKALGASETLRSAARRWVTSAGILFSGAGPNATRVEDEIRVAIVERTIFDDVNVRAIDTARTDRDVVADLIFETGSVFTKALRLESGIWRGSIGAQIGGSAADDRK